MRRTRPSSVAAGPGLEALRAVVALCARTPQPAGASYDAWILMAADVAHGRGGGSALHEPEGADDAEGRRIAALVDLARGGDAEAFGELYDHYLGSIHRYLYFRVSDPTLAEDLTSETFFRALRSIGSFRWQGKDFGAWLTTIARNLVADHYKSSRNRLEMPADELPDRSSGRNETETDVMAMLTSEELVRAMRRLVGEQQDCLVMRFCQGLSIAETARALARTEGAVKQLQLRAVRNLAKMLPEDPR